MKLLDKITPLEENFYKWYTDVITKGNLMMYGPVKGSIIFMPNAYGMWENIQSLFNMQLKKVDVKNVYLPMLIPESLINLEKQHVKGFAPELITVEKVGEKSLAEKLFLRPTSEVIFAQYFKEQTHSYKDLPLQLNQWANVFRWEKTTNPFLRTSEFLWQEGHTIHSTPKEAKAMTKKMINIYQKFISDYLAIPTILGKKTQSEKFAGAHSTYTVEGIMKDGKALQCGTSHYFAQNFSKVYDIKFKNSNNIDEFVYQTSWGISTRLLGAIIMTHGDNRGIIMPPKIATNQIDVLSIFGDKNPQVITFIKEIAKKLKKYRFRLDLSDKQPGFKASQSEIEGTPIRIEVGPKDTENNQVTIIRRDTLEKEQVKYNDLVSKIDFLLKDIHNNLLEKAKYNLSSKLVEVFNIEDFKFNLENGKFVKVPFNGTQKDEEKIKELTFATPRCIIKSTKSDKKQPCFWTKKLTNRYVIFAKAY